MPFKLSDLLQPFEDFFKRQASGGLVLIGATVLALVLANSPAAPYYHAFWETKLTIGFDNFGLSHSLHHWINDGLMAIFFFVVGLELKRELLAGELASPRKAALPIAAAVGGMLVPALIFLAINPGPPEADGWGIPMATDIAFALGVIALLGKRVSRSMAIFLTALAIADDLGAVLVIALFYSGPLSSTALALAAGFLALLIIGNRLDIQHPNYYALIGVALWAALLKSGIHASIAGVLIGFTIPVRARHGDESFLNKSFQLLERYKTMERTEGPFHNEQRLGTLLALEHVCHNAMSPLQRMEHEMNGWVIFGVMPIFALANAGIHLAPSEIPTALAHPVTLGVMLGLLLGKPLGILSFSWLAVRLKFCELPRGGSWSELAGIGILAGIGFTMSMFITNLAFIRPELATAAKFGIFTASLIAGCLGYALLYRITASKV
ncbi:MAG: Na+/H+ antiporter NhaA [Desulfuromonadaceae bacterium GWC2_58_13]|nr:MAG: Na+/H+ antiporter NhaA [Desulfuromonadaceae bacterium GWC2_58_13]